MTHVGDMQLDKYKHALRRVSEELNKRGVDHVLVGSAVLPLVYNIKYDSRDVDLRLELGAT